MGNKFITFLEAVGTDFKNGLVKIDPLVKEGLVKIDPLVKEGIAITQDSLPEVSAIDPAIGAVLKTTIATVASIEQKFAAMNMQTGTGAQKLAQATTILSPVVSQAFAAAGKVADITTVQNYITAVVNFLNAIPAGTSTLKAA